jgi:antitoxin VapB
VLVEGDRTHYVEVISKRTAMLLLAPDTEQLARRVAARVGRKPEDLIHAALEREAKALGVADELPVRTRMTAAEMLVLGREVAAMPILDRRSPREIAEDLSDI